MPDFKELVQNLYTSKNRELTSDKLDYIQKTYAGKEQDFVKNFYATIGEDLTEDKFNYINDTYLKKKEPTISPSLGTQSQLPLQEGNKLVSGSFLSDVGDKPQPKQKQKSGFLLGEEVAQTQSSRPSSKIFQGVKPIASDKEPDIKEAIDFTVNERIKNSRGVYDKTLPNPTKEEINKEKDFVTNLYKNGELVPVKENGKSKLVRGTGAIESFLNAVNTKFEHEAVNNFLANANEEEKINYLNNKLLVTQEQKSAPSGVGGEIGEFVGENIGMLGKGVIASLAATQAALPTGGGSYLQFLSMAEDMGYGGYGSVLESNYIRLKQQNPNISDKEAYDKANNAALVGEITGLATNAALAGSISQNLLGKAPKPNIEVKGVLDGIVNSAKHAVKSYPKVGGVSVAGSLINDLASKGIGVDVKGDEMASNALESAKQMAIMHFGLWGMTEPFKIPSYIRPQIENLVASAPREEVADFYQDGEQKGIFKQGTTQMVLSKLSKFDEQKAVLANMPLSEEQKAAMTGKLLQRQKLVEENSQLKKYGSSFNDKIIENEAKINQLDKETNGISKTKDIFKFEKDNITGEPAKIKEESEVLQPTEDKISTTETVSEVIGEPKEGEVEFKNRVFESNVQLGEAPKEAHISEEGYNYRTLSSKEIDSITESGEVLPREGKQKGGNVNTKYWTKGNGKNWYGDKESQETIRVKQDKFSENKPVKAEDLEIYNKETKQFEPLIKEKQTPSELPIVKEEGGVGVEAKKADIERRRQEELDSVDISKGGKIPIEGYEEFYKNVKAKYDAELAALKIPKAEVKPTEAKEEGKLKPKPIIAESKRVEVEPEAKEGVKVATLSGMTESERAERVKERQKETGLNEREVNNNDLIKMADAAQVARGNEKSKIQGAIRQKVRELNSKLGDEFYRYNGVFIQVKSKSKKVGDRFVKAKGTSRDSSLGALKEGSVLLMDRDENFKRKYEELVDSPNLTSLDVDRGDGVRMTEAQIESAVQDIADGIPSVQANNLLNALENGFNKNLFDLKDKTFGKVGATLDEFIGVDKENVTTPMDEEALMAYLEDEANMTKEEKENINDLINEYEQQPRTIEVEGEIPEAKPTTKEGGAKQPEPVKKGEEKRESYKDLTRNEKRQIINSKFDELLKELKIEKICPT
jgi:hypothetical protein